MAGLKTSLGWTKAALIVPTLTMVCDYLVPGIQVKSDEHFPVGADKTFSALMAISAELTMSASICQSLTSSNPVGGNGVGFFFHTFDVAVAFKRNEKTALLLVRLT